MPISIDLAVVSRTKITPQRNIIAQGNRAILVRDAWRVVRLIAKFIDMSHNAQRKTHNAQILEIFPLGRQKSPKNGNLPDSGIKYFNPIHPVHP